MLVGKLVDVQADRRSPESGAGASQAVHSARVLVDGARDAAILVQGRPGDGRVSQLLPTDFHNGIWLQVDKNVNYRMALPGHVAKSKPNSCSGVRHVNFAIPLDFPIAYRTDFTRSAITHELYSSI